MLINLFYINNPTLLNNTGFAYSNYQRGICAEQMKHSSICDPRTNLQENTSNK